MSRDLGLSTDYGSAERTPRPESAEKEGVGAAGGASNQPTPARTNRRRSGGHLLFSSPGSRRRPSLERISNLPKPGFGQDSTMLPLDPQQQNQANKPASSAFRANSNVVVDPSRDLLGDSACRGSSVWSVLPSDPSGVSASLVATSSKVLESPAPSSMGPLTASATAQQTTALSAMQDAAAAYDPTRMITGSYYSHPYTAAASSGSYGVNSNYYQSLRNAAGFGYFPATPSSYGAYSTGGFDYTYPNCYGSSTGRNGYYGATGAAALGYFPAGSNYPNTLPDSKSSSSQISPLGQSLRCSDLKKTNGKSSKKKKTTNGTATPEEHYTRVFIWDLEDICAFSNVMLNAKTPDSVPMSDDAKRIVSRIISEVFHIDNGEISECEQVNIEDANVDETMQDIGGFGECPSGGENGSSPPQTMRSGVDWLRKVATRYQQVREAYNQCRNGASVFGDQSGLENQRTRALEMIKLAFMSLGGGAERWSDDVKACLGIISERSVSTARYANVVISNEGLVTSCAKLMATDLAPMVQIDNIYSTVKMTKDSVIERIRTKFGKNCSFVVISAQPDTQSLGKAKMIPTWRVMQTSHLEAFYVALKQYLLDHQHSNRQFREV